MAPREPIGAEDSHSLREGTARPARHGLRTHHPAAAPALLRRERRPFRALEWEWQEQRAWHGGRDGIPGRDHQGLVQRQCGLTELRRLRQHHGPQRQLLQVPQLRLHERLQLKTTPCRGAPRHGHRGPSELVSQELRLQELHDLAGLELLFNRVKVCEMLEPSPWAISMALLVHPFNGILSGRRPVNELGYVGFPLLMQIY